MKSNTLSKLLSTAALVLLLGTLLLSIGFRFWKLDSIPFGANWDEAAYGYNAYSILLTGKDEWGVQFPLFLKSFGDYKPALLSYLQIPFIQLLGLNVLATRLPVALLSVVSVFAWYYIQKQYAFFKDSKHAHFLLYLGTVLFSTAPWLVHYSRAAMDPIVSFAFLMLGLALFTSKKMMTRWFGVVSLVLAMYTYNSARIFVPIIIVAQFVFFERENIFVFIQKQQPRALQYGTVFFASVLILLFSLFTEAGARAQSVFFLSNPTIHTETAEAFTRSVTLGIPGVGIFAHKGITSFYLLAKNYLVHFDPSFLFFENTLSARHGFSRHGNLLLVTLPLILLGMVFQKRSTKNDWFFLFWLLIAVIPSALSDDVPHSGRTLLQLPAYIYFATRGVEFLLTYVASLKFSKKVPVAELLMLLITGAVSFNVALYFVDMYRYFPEESYGAWQGDVRTVMEYLTEEKRNEYAQVVVSNELIDRSIFYSFYTMQDPAQVQQSLTAVADSFTHENVRVAQLGICDLSLKDSLIISEKKLETIMPWQDTILAQTRFGEPTILGYVYNTTVFPESYLAELAQSCEK